MHDQKRNSEGECQRSVQKLMAENCQGKNTVALLFPYNQGCREMNSLQQNNSMITCRAQHRAGIIPVIKNNVPPETYGGLEVSSIN